MKWTKRAILGFLTLVVLLAASGAAYQAIASARDQRNVPPPGQLVDVGAYRLHLNTMGEYKGGPTVILDSGSLSASFQWGWVQPKIAEFTQVVAYDRPGTGWSDPPPEPMNARELADDLHEALDVVGAQGPYVVVGHSMGSLTARAFAARYPENVSGAVLVEPRNLSLAEDFPEQYPDGVPTSGPPLELRLMSVAGHLGLMRLADPLGVGEYAEQLPPQQAAEAKAYSASNKLHKGMWPDVLLAESAVPDIRERGLLGEKPLVILSAGQDEGLSEGEHTRVTNTHREMAGSISSEGEHRIIEGADHSSIVTERQHAQDVAHTVQEVVDAVREPR
jgi:pimeloyl-ACP methyl ester carboxylesterase